MVDSSLQDIICCLGHPVGGNPTQYVLEKGFQTANIDWRCLTLDVLPARLAAAIRGLAAMGFRGAMLAAPHFEAACEHLDQLSETAGVLQSVDQLTVDEDQVHGDNLFARGLLVRLAEMTDMADKHVTVLGTGRAARAAAFELARAGAGAVEIVGRSQEEGATLAELLRQHSSAEPHVSVWTDSYAISESSDILIHAGSIHVARGQGDPQLNLSTLSADTIVADLTSQAPQTAFLEAAGAAGCRTINGLELLVHRLSDAFRSWTQVDPDETVLREALEEFLMV